MTVTAEEDLDHFWPVITPTAQVALEHPDRSSTPARPPTPALPTSSGTDTSMGDATTEDVQSTDFASPESPVLTGQRMDDDNIVEITEEAADPIIAAPPISLQREAARRSTRSSRAPERFAPERNPNDTAIRAARAAELNPLYAPQTSTDVEMVPDASGADHAHLALHLREVQRPKVLQHSGVAKELTAWRESMTIKEAKQRFTTYLIFR